MDIKKIMNENKIKSAIIIIITIIIIIITIAYMYQEIEKDKSINIDDVEIIEKQEETENKEKEENKEVTEKLNQVEQENGNIEKIAVHIIGEINKPGIIYLPIGARIIDAINKAGGTTKNAGLDKINLAYILEDGQKVYIPNKTEEMEEKEYISSTSGDNIILEEGNTKSDTNIKNNVKSSKKGEKKVNINTANQTELETIPGIGPSIAQKILEYRQKNGNFQKIEDIQNVKGIGDSKYSNIKEHICI